MRCAKNGLTCKNETQGVSFILRAVLQKTGTAAVKLLMLFFKSMQQHLYIMRVMLNYAAPSGVESHIIFEKSLELYEAQAP